MKQLNTNFVLGFIGVLFILFIIIASPFALMWSWNVLFNKLLVLEYTFENWVAVSIFMWAFGLLKLDFTHLNNKHGNFR
jgi:hypothetical protein